MTESGWNGPEYNCVLCGKPMLITTGKGRCVHGNCEMSDVWLPISAIEKIEQLRSKPLGSEWIKVADRLPLDSGWYTCIKIMHSELNPLLNGTPYVGSAYFWDAGFSANGAEVLAWQERLTLPSEKEIKKLWYSEQLLKNKGITYDKNI